MNHIIPKICSVRAVFPSLKVHHPKRTIYKNRRNEERHGGRNSIKFDPQSSDKNVFVTPPPSFILSITFSRFAFSLSLSLSLFFSLLRIPRSSLCPPPPPPFSFVLLVSLSSRDKMGQNTKRTKPQIYNFAMRIIIEYQKLCYSLFHSAHLLPQRAVFPRRGNKSSR